MSAASQLRVQLPTDPQDILAERRRIATDFAYFAEKYCKVADKNGNSVAFRLNKVQRDLLDAINKQWRERGMVRIVILKARQQGFSTFMQAYTYWYMKHRSTKTGYVVAQDKTTSTALFQKLRYTHKMMPDAIRPRLSKGSVREMAFEDLDTSIEVATAGGDDLGRGRTINMLWASELAFWPEAVAYDNLQAVLVACPNVQGSIVVAESTAKGVSGPYYDLYHNAPDNGFERFFSPWNDSEDYRNDNYHDDFGVDGTAYELTIEEKQLQQTYGLDLAQLHWRRIERTKAENEGRFKREYPICADEAFQNSGAPVFNAHALQELFDTAEPPIARYAYGEAEDAFAEESRGDLIVFEEPVEAVTYTIGVDVGLGQGGDYSVAQVFDHHRTQVAVYRTNTVAPRVLAKVMNRLGHRYNTAEIIVESMHAGHTACDRLGHDLHYPNLWRRVVDTKLAEAITDNIGFHTNKQSKIMVIDRLRDDLNHGKLKINCLTTLSEMREYVKMVPKGKSEDAARMSAPAGKNDDCVMALALANYITVGEVIPIPKALLESSYLGSF